ncbi:MAG: MarR family winged helix-turn-helix transcriptional regulator [Methylophilus sp.]|uniref:MarR family winged helix-turn-helix transcriptional regulator n=1 Tax=Methylophilus sp. TaxID=29541 RepID=UPI003F9F02C6
MLQLRDLPTPEVLQRFAERYPAADVTAIASFLMLLRVATDLSVALDACLTKHDLLQGRWWVLILLMRERDLTSQPSVLAEKLGITRATMTGLLDGLEQSGLVQRVSAPQDRRSVQIKLTPAGQAKLDAVMPDYYSRLRLCMQGLSERQRNDLQSILGVIDDGMSAWDFNQ